MKSLLSNPITLILIILILVVIFNLALFAYAKGQLKFTSRGSLDKLTSTIKTPFNESDSDLDHLADLVDHLDPDLKSNQENSNRS